MKPPQANHEIEAMKAVLATLEWLKAGHAAKVPQ
jgi:hypothetical protein